ncbi:MAG TPA: hypothetical protein EYN80_04115 [Alphaproteobacteria bacterium]|nr:hypothetical protein [Alphaproteobacteria bacterium]HIA21613.1 hypothetical protein [Alphaproteobacteria bacterium]HIB19643.1 hypothetical protein [Alphaproteobacteria bacterium]HIN92353.1 hypothetical protein [Alphaproteobacteria bacterium]
MTLPEVVGNRSQAALVYCAEQVRKHDHDRYLCSLFAPSRSRSALWALYALNIELARTREMVTQPMLGQVRLKWWREAFEGLCEGEPPKHMVVEALALSWPSIWTAQNYFLSLIDARMVDLADRPLKTLEELERYLEATSASLMELSLFALNVNDAASKAAGREIGLAWGFIGLIRVLPFRSASRQLCVPTSILSELGFSSAERCLGPSSILTRAVKIIADQAMDHLGIARASVLEAPRAARAALSLGVLARLYLDRLANADYNPYAANFNVSSLRRLAKLGMSWR